MHPKIRGYCGGDPQCPLTREIPLPASTLWLQLQRTRPRCATAAQPRPCTPERRQGLWQNQWSQHNGCAAGCGEVCVAHLPLLPLADAKHVYLSRFVEGIEEKFEIDNP